MTKLKDIVSKDADWVRSPRSVLTPAQKAYVFDAPLNVQTPTTLSVDVVNTWETRPDDYLIV